MRRRGVFRCPKKFFIHAKSGGERKNGGFSLPAFLKGGGDVKIKLETSRKNVRLGLGGGGFINTISPFWIDRVRGQ